MTSSASSIIDQADLVVLPSSAPADASDAANDGHGKTSAKKQTTMSSGGGNGNSGALFTKRMSLDSNYKQARHSTGNIEEHVDAALSRCRYKTGKCTQKRSYKRNGQMHQLCVYHREKANRIQRKFDRQKRQVLRHYKGSSSPTYAMGGGAKELNLVNPALEFVVNHMNKRSMSSILNDAPMQNHMLVMRSKSLSALDAVHHDASSSPARGDASSFRFSMESGESKMTAQDPLWSSTVPPPFTAPSHSGKDANPTTASLSSSSLAAVCPYDPTSESEFMHEDEIEFLCSAVLA